MNELYGWSNRKKGDSVPDANGGPWRNNINGVKWGGDIMVIRMRMTQHYSTCPDNALKNYSISWRRFGDKWWYYCKDR